MRRGNQKLIICKLCNHKSKCAQCAWLRTNNGFDDGTKWFRIRKMLGCTIREIRSNPMYRQTAVELCGNNTYGIQHSPNHLRIFPALLPTWHCGQSAKRGIFANHLCISTGCFDCFMNKWDFNNFLHDTCSTHADMKNYTAAVILNQSSILSFPFDFGLCACVLSVSSMS